MNEQIIKEIFSDEIFVKSLLNLETAEEVQAALTEKEIELTVDEINALKIMLSKGGEELSEDDLENVSGGIAFGLIISIGACLFSVGTFVNTVTNRRW